MLLDVGILLGIYVGVRLFKGNRKKNQPQNLGKLAQISADQSVVRENLTIQQVKSTQPLVEETTSDSPEKEPEHYFKISIASMGLAAIGNISMPLHILSIGIITYTSLPILKHAENSMIQEGKIGHSMLVSVLSILALMSNQSFALTVAIFFYHFGGKLLAKTQAHSKKMLTNLFGQQPYTVWVLKEQVEMEVPLEAVRVNANNGFLSFLKLSNVLLHWEQRLLSKQMPVRLRVSVTKLIITLEPQLLTIKPICIKMLTSFCGLNVHKMRTMNYGIFRLTP